MDFVYIGKYVNTHGIKGEIKIISDIQEKSLIFKKGFKLYIGKNKQPYLINSYRTHKNYDMVTLEGIDNINQIIDLKGENVYINRLDLDHNILFNSDYIGMKVYTDKLVGEVVDIIKNTKYDILVVKGKTKFMVPKIDEFITKIDAQNKTIYINNIKGLIDEN